MFKHRHEWQTIETKWPHPEGTAQYCPHCQTMTDFRPRKAVPATSPVNSGASELISSGD